MAEKSPLSPAFDVPNAPPTSLSDLPGDILLEIASWSHSCSDILHLAQTSRRIFTNVVRILYANVELTTARQCTTTLGMLFCRPDIARHTRKLVVRPGSDLSLVSSFIRRVALCLDALHTFEWDAEEMPDEDVWFALRVFCPKLRRISTTVGSKEPSLNCHLFDFADLLSFSLTLKSGFCGKRAQTSDLWMTRLFRDVLIKGSPNIEEISILTSFWYPVSVLDADYLASARWQNLSKFCVGNLLIDQRADLGPIHPYTAFLEAHRKLNSIQLSKYSLANAFLYSISTRALPDITNFEGTLEQVQKLPHIHSRLRSLSLCNPIFSAELRHFPVAAVLKSMTALTDLRISFILDYAYNSISLLRSLITACPQLVCLDLSCLFTQSFQLHSFAKAIRGFTKLRHLSLALVKNTSEDALSIGAERIARANPWLQTIKLTYVKSQENHRLPPSVKESGTYTFLCDEHGLPRTLIAREQRNVVLPWGLGVHHRSSKRYSKNLRPFGYPGQAKRGFWWSVVENSVAGEEARMILCCLLLLGLAVWGIVSGKRK